MKKYQRGQAERSAQELAQELMLAQEAAQETAQEHFMFFVFSPPSSWPRTLPSTRAWPRKRPR